MLIISQRIVFFMCMILIASFAVVSLTKTQALAADVTKFVVPDLIVFPDEGSKPLEEFIKSANRQIDIASPTFDDPAILKVLASARARGVRIRVMLDRYSEGTEAKNKDAEKNLASTGILTSWSNPIHKHLHESLIIVDGSVAAALTFPMEEDAITKGRNFAVVFQDPRNISEIQAAFNADWGKNKYNPVYANVIFFSPENLRIRLRELIYNAKNTISIYTEKVADPEMEDIIGNAAKRGLIVRFLTSDSSAEGKPGLIKLGMLGVNIRTLQAPHVYGTVMIVDEKNKEALALISSTALTTKSLDEQREIGAIVSDNHRISRLKTAFKKDWPIGQK